MSNDAYIGVRMPRELVDTLAAQADRERYTLSDEVRRALWRHAEGLQSDNGRLDPATAVQTRSSQETAHAG